ncbi:hypothetical protein CPter291_3958 [Collimonas pratensis]|uniref:Uncharacterized protein n=1 Tax=Collimonas pratensis TaxID=279113 RepID=A0ABM5ZAV9_9BURK|nr:hypothetical protein CPter291_3958 [Collimonas pratensis]
MFEHAAATAAFTPAAALKQAAAPMLPFMTLMHTAVVAASSMTKHGSSLSH